MSAAASFHSSLETIFRVTCKTVHLPPERDCPVMFDPRIAPSLIARAIQAECPSQRLVFDEVW